MKPVSLVRVSHIANTSLLLMSFLSMVATFSLTASTAEAQSSVKFDLDADDLSEIVQLTIQEDDTVDWQILSSSSGYTTALSQKEEFGEAGIAVAIGDWRGDGGVDYAYVENRDGAPLKWDVEDGSAVDTYEFGGVKHFVLSGLDVDGSGALEAITIRKGGRITVRLDPFASGSGEIVTSLPKRATRSIASGDAQPFYFRDGSGARVGTVYTNKSGTRYRYLVNNYNGGVREGARLGAVRGDIIEVVEILDENGTPHILLQETHRKKQSRVRIYTLAGTQVFTSTYLGRTLLVGNYVAGASGEQFAIQNGDTLTVVSPFDGIDNADITLPSDSVLADLANVNDFSNTGSGSGGGSNPGLNSVCPNVFDFGTGRLWKPEADASDNRKHKPVVLLTGSNKTGDSALTVYDSQGNVVCSGFTFKASSIPGVNGGADHYFSGWIGGCGLTASQIGSAAQSNTGSRTVYLEWKSNACLRVPEPTNRYGGV